MPRLSRLPLPIRLAVSRRRLQSTRSITTTAPTSQQLPPSRNAHIPSQSPITTKLDFFKSASVSASGVQSTHNVTGIPMYRILDGVGKVLDGATLPEIDEAFARKLYRTMQLLPTLDNILYNVQRQGKISFYMTTHGEEATVVGSAAALKDDDEVLGQYREMGVLLWRGFSIDAVMAQCFGNEEDDCTKGRQMPVHFGSPTHHFHTISSPLATQIPQAAGVGYALKRDPKRRGKNCAAVYFGEGAASEGDFHAGMLLASTVPSPTLFLARNNGFAISTPSTEQYHGDGIASRGPGYGVDTIRVDGNDVLAVLGAVREGRRRCVESGRAVLVEAMTYRVGHHSTSDDSFAYRPRSEVENRKAIDNPLTRFRLFLEQQGWWTPEQDEELRAELKSDVLKAFKRAEGLKHHELKELFTDVYGGEEPWNITEQRNELSALLDKYGNVWEPWKNELKKFKGEGSELMRSLGISAAPSRS